MKPPDLESGAVRIRHGLQEVLRIREEAAPEWNDSTRDAFDEQHLEPMVPMVKTALDAIGRMHGLLRQAHRDCEQ